MNRRSHTYIFFSNQLLYVCHLVNKERGDLCTNIYVFTSIKEGEGLVEKLNEQAIKLKKNMKDEKYLHFINF